MVAINSTDAKWYNNKEEYCTLWNQQRHEDGNNNVPSGYQINNNKFLQWEILEQAIHCLVCSRD